MQVISFYSFKGGAGRTVCTANMIPLLARDFGATAQNPMLIMDLDLDSAGLTHILNLYWKFEDSQWVSSNLLKQGGNDEIILTKLINQKILLNEDFYSTADEINEKKEALYEVVGKLKEFELSKQAELFFDNINIRKSVLKKFAYLIFQMSNKEIRDKVVDLNQADSQKKLVAIIDDSVPACGMVDISSNFEGFEEGSIRFIGVRQTGLDNTISGEALRKLNKLIDCCAEKNFCALIMDSASGTQPIANTIHNIKENIIVYCLRLTEQFREGTYLRIRDFIDSHKLNNNPVNIILLPVAVPSEEYKERYNLKDLKKMAISDLEIKADKISEILSKNNESQVIIHKDFIKSGIPEVESFKWYEKILLKVLDREEDEEAALSGYKALSQKIRKMSK